MSEPTSPDQTLHALAGTTAESILGTSVLSLSEVYPKVIFDPWGYHFMLGEGVFGWTNSSPSLSVEHPSTH